MNRSGGVRLLLRRARGEHDAHGLLHALEDARVDLRLVALRRAVDDPDVVAGAAEVVAHLLKAWTAEEAGHGDEADDAVFGCAGPWSKTFQVAQRQK